MTSPIKTDPVKFPLEDGITPAHMITAFGMGDLASSSMLDSLGPTLDFSPPDAENIEELLYKKDNPDWSRLNALEAKVCLLHSEIEHEADWLEEDNWEPSTEEYE